MAELQQANRGERLRRNKKKFAIVALGLGLFAGALLGELAMRGWLAWRTRGSMDSRDFATPTDPNAPVFLGDLIYANGDPDTIYRLKPGLRGKFMGQPLAINALGFRDDAVAVPKPSGSFRVLGLGDSFSFGWGVAQGEDFLAQTEHWLKQIAPGRHIETVNMSCPGYNAHMEIALLEQAGLALEPDMVVIQYHINDATLPLFLQRRDYMTRLDRLFLWDLKDVLRGRGKEFMTNAAAPSQNRQNILHPENAPEEPDPKEVRPELANKVGAESVRQAYRRLAAICRERSIPLLAIVPAERTFDYDAAATRDPHFDFIRSLLAELGIDAVEAFPLEQRYLVEGRLPSEMLFVDGPGGDYHPSLIRHTLWTQAILPAVASAAGVDNSAQVAAAVEQLKRDNEPRIAAWLAAHPDSPVASAGGIPFKQLHSEGTTR